MTRLHVIWDRDGVLQNHQLPREKFKVAIIDIASDVQPKEFIKLAASLAKLLLVQFTDSTDQK